MIDSKYRHKSLSKSYVSGEKAQITPPSAYNIKVYENCKGNGDLIIENDTMLYLSVAMKSNDKILREHIHGPNNIIPSQDNTFFLGISSEVDLNQPKGMDCDIEVITPSGNSRVSRTLLFKNTYDLIFIYIRFIYSPN